MEPIKTTAEYFKIALIDNLESLDSISKWADSIIEKSENIPDWALELTFAKTKSIDEVVTNLAGIEGKADDLSVMRRLMLRVFEYYQMGKFKFEEAINISYRILLRQYNILQGGYSLNVRELYLDIMRLDDSLDHLGNERIGSLDKIKEGYSEFISKMKSDFEK